MKFTLAALLAALYAIGASAAAYPNLISPTTGSVWTNGETATITWNTTGWETSTEKVRFFVGHPIADGYEMDQFVDRDTESGQEGSLYPITQGNVSFTVQVAAAPRSDFIVEIYSASGNNISPEFTINAA